METQTTENLLLQIEELQNRIAKADKIIETLKAGKVDAIALNENNKSEDELYKSEEKYRSLFNSIHDAFCIIEMIFDEKGKPIDWIYLETNLAFLQHATVEMKGKRISEIVPEMETIWLEKYGGVAKTGKSVQLEHMVKELGNQWFQTSAFSHGTQGSNRVAVIFSNITERKQAEEKLRESESRFRSIADASPVLIWSLDANGLSSFYNKTFLDFIGASTGEDISVWAKIVHPNDLKPTLDTINTAFEKRIPFSLECRLLRADGHWRCVLSQGNPRIGANNQFLGFVGSSVDITERKEAERTIKVSEQRFHELIYSSPSMMAILKGENMTIEIANDAILATWGKGKAVIGQSIFSVLPEIVEQGFNKLLLDVYKTGAPFYAYEAPVTLLRSGISELLFYNYFYQPQRNINGEIEGVAIFANEVTSQALLNKKIKASEERFKQLILQAPVAICVLRGEDYLIETMNEGMCAFWGRTFEQALHKPVFDVLPEVRNQGIKELLDNVYHTGERCVMQELSLDIIRNGKLENVFVKFVYEPLRETDGSISGVMALAHEITEQVMARKKLEKSEKKFEAAMLAVEGNIWTNNANGEMEGEQPGWAKLTGQSYSEYCGYGWANAVHPNDAQPTREAWSEAVKTKSTFEFEHRLLTKQNGWRLFSVKAVPALDQNGTILQLVGVHTDITQHRKAEISLKESEERFRNLVETLPQMVWVMDVEGKMEYGSKNWKEYSGIDGVADAWNYMMHPDDKERLTTYWEVVFRKGKGYQHEVRLKNKEGIYRWFYSVGEPVLDADKKLIKWVGSLTDIHEQKRGQERKDEFISIASHEMKTPLTTTKAYLQMLERSLDAKDIKALYAKKASQSVNRLEELIGELLDVSKIQLGRLNYTVTTFNFNEMIDSTVENLQIITSTHSIIKTGKAVNEVKGDKNRLQQVLINLLTNAIKYSPGKDTVFLTVEQINDDIKISVKDSGIGMSEESLKIIFDKYHRLEEHAMHFQGLGIGLFISYQIIERHHGKLWAESEVGKGSTFYFTIPINSTLSE